MDLYYYRDSIGNFGDDLNPWLWPKLIPDLLQEDVFSDTLFLGIGTLINKSVPVSKNKLVFGAGAGYGELPHLDDKWKIFCVRGPLTAQALSLPSNTAVTDAAILVRNLEIERASQNYEVSFMPHHRTARKLKLSRLCNMFGIGYIDPSENISSVLTKIVSSKFLITEAMHGAIVADSVRVPWIPVVLSKKILKFKWDDWTLSMNLKYNPIIIGKLDFSSRLDKLNSVMKAPLLVSRLYNTYKNIDPIMSSDSVFESRLNQYRELLSEVKRAYL